jgi:hypothetical protein
MTGLLIGAQANQPSLCSDERPAAVSERKTREETAA